MSYTKDIILKFSGEYRFLSNYWYVDIELDDIIYPTIEHAFQASKTFIESERELIKNSGSPHNAKRLGQKVTLRTDWEEVKLGIMKDLLFKKFSIPKYKEKLLSTGTRDIQEGNTWGDTFWGIDLNTGKGENHLGKILMQIREELRT